MAEERASLKDPETEIGRSSRFGMELASFSEKHKGSSKKKRFFFAFILLLVVGGLVAGLVVASGSEEPAAVPSQGKTIDWAAKEAAGKEKVASVSKVLNGVTKLVIKPNDPSLGVNSSSIDGLLKATGTTELEMTDIVRVTTSAKPPQEYKSCSQHEDCRGCNDPAATCNTRLGRCTASGYDIKLADLKGVGVVCPESMCNYPYDKEEEGYEEEITKLFAGFPLRRRYKIDQNFNEQRDADLGGAPDIMPTEAFYSNVTWGGIQLQTYGAFFLPNIEDDELTPAFATRIDLSKKQIGDLKSQGKVIDFAWLFSSFPMLRTNELGKTWTNFNNDSDESKKWEICRLIVVTSTHRYRRFDFDVVAGLNVFMRVKAPQGWKPIPGVDFAPLDGFEVLFINKTYIYNFRLRVSFDFDNTDITLDFQKDPFERIDTGTDKLIIDHVGLGTGVTSHEAYDDDIDDDGLMRKSETPEGWEDETEDARFFVRIGAQMQVVLSTKKDWEVKFTGLIAAAFKAPSHLSLEMESYDWTLPKIIDNVLEIHRFGTRAALDFKNFSGDDTSIEAVLDCTLKIGGFKPRMLLAGKMKGNGAFGFVWETDLTETLGETIGQITESGGAKTWVQKHLTDLPDMKFFVSFASQGMLIDSQDIDEGLVFWVQINFDVNRMQGPVGDAFRFFNLIDPAILFGAKIPEPPGQKFELFFSIEFGEITEPTVKGNLFDLQQLKLAVNLDPKAGFVEVAVRLQTHICGPNRCYACTQQKNCEYLEDKGCEWNTTFVKHDGSKGGCIANKNAEPQAQLVVEALGRYDVTPPSVYVQGALIGEWKDITCAMIGFCGWGIDISNFAVGLGWNVGSPVPTKGAFSGRVQLASDMFVDAAVVLIPDMLMFGLDVQVENWTWEKLFQVLAEKTAKDDYKILLNGAGKVAKSFQKLQIAKLDLTIAPYQIEIGDGGRVIPQGFHLVASFLWNDIQFDIKAGIFKQDPPKQLTIGPVKFNMAFDLTSDFMVRDFRVLQTLVPGIGLLQWLLDKFLDVVETALETIKQLGFDFLSQSVDNWLAKAQNFLDNLFTIKKFAITNLSVVDLLNGKACVKFELDLAFFGKEYSWEYVFDMEAILNDMKQAVLKFVINQLKNSDFGRVVLDKLQNLFCGDRESLEQQTKSSAQDPVVALGALDAFCGIKFDNAKPFEGYKSPPTACSINTGSG
mmetsp:Transcript_10592/g.20068  ORF Transcript_10592/g.20068 Transcript_10592/m.20068 type:complete len:1196 (-) Transcript_10592:328-3915(-)